MTASERESIADITHRFRVHADLCTSAPRLDYLVDGRFALQTLLGTGPLGATFKAVDLAFGEIVALKIAVDPAQSPSVESCAEVARRLGECTGVAFVDRGDHDGHAYFARTYVHHQLGERLRAGRPLRPARALALLGHLAASLEHAHTIGGPHGALGPSQVLIEHNEGVEYAYVVDFRSHAEVHPTGTDTFGLAVIAYAMLTGDRDATGLHDRRGEPIEPIGPARVRTLRALWDVFDAALAPVPTHRPSVREFVEELATVFGNVGLGPPPPGR